MVKGRLRWGGERGRVRGEAEVTCINSSFKCDLHCQNFMQIEFQKFYSTEMITETFLWMHTTVWNNVLVIKLGKIRNELSNNNNSVRAYQKIRIPVTG